MAAVSFAYVNCTAFCSLPERRRGYGQRPARATIMVETRASNFRAPQLAFLDAWPEYLVDSVQRAVLFWDVTRKRGDNFLENTGRGGPPVLFFDYDVLIDGQ